MTFRLTWTAVLAVLLCLGCGDSKSGTTEKSAATEDRTTGRGPNGNSDAGPEGNTDPEPSDSDASPDEVVADFDAGVVVDAGAVALEQAPDAGDGAVAVDAGAASSDDSEVAAPEHVESFPDNGLGFRFTDVTEQAGVEALQWQVPTSWDGYPCSHALQVTGGAAAADINGDGWIDLFVTRLEQPNLLYLNNGDGTFREAAREAKLKVTRWSNSPTFGDVDGDSDLDLFVTTAGPAKAMLFINRGDGTFAEEAAARGVAVGRTDACSELTSASFGDYDHDGSLDLYISQWTAGGEDSNFLFQNDGTGYFSNVTQAAGIMLEEPKGYSSGFIDADGDGWDELFVVADFSNSQLYHNNGDGTFTNVTEIAGVGTEEDGMGSALGDVNGDGFPDWFVSNTNDPGVTTGNRLYINRGDGSFDDSSAAYGITEGGWGWGALLLDVDNDGNLDASNVSGWTTGDEMPHLWLGGSLPWRNVGVTAGLDRAINGRAYVPFDFDRDGDQDLFIVRNGATPILYRNDTRSSNHWLVVKVQGSTSNAQGVGARVELTHPDGKVQHRWITANNNFLGHGPFEAHFGLGEDAGPFTIRVSWPSSGKAYSHALVEPDQVITMLEP